MNKLRIMTILGTRPEIIRLACILSKMDEYFEHIIVHTQQSYDYELSEIFFKNFDLRRPDYTLNVKAETIGKQIANILEQSERVLLKEKPDALFVLGDTNSSLSAILAKRMKIPIFHMEAGNRSFDWNVPEEVNRRIVDHISDYNLAYTEHSRRYLIEEGIRPDSIFVVGSPLTEVFEYYKNKIDASNILGTLGVSPQKYIVVSAHREENVDNHNNIKELFESLSKVAEKYDMPIVISLHPRTKKIIEALKIKIHKKLLLHKPFGYFDYNKLQKNALCVLSDSGSIQEESAIMQFPGIQIRVSTERPEAFDAGSIILIGFHSDAIVNAIEYSMKNRQQTIVVPEAYRDVNVSAKIVKLVMGMTSIRTYC